MEPSLSSSELLKGKGCILIPVHAYNPSYSGGIDQDDLGSKPAPDK
jgi:hypothetical protein